MILNFDDNWNAPAHWHKITTIDAHTAGEPLRIILDGYPELHGETILKKRAEAKTQWDHFRKALMWEPRGHADMYGCVITQPVSNDSDFGVLFLHNEGYSSMCGHAIIAVTKVVLEIGMFKKQSPETIIKIDTPAGQVKAYAQIKDDKVDSVRFHNVPSFVLARDEIIDVPGLGKITYDIAYGGAFYAFVKEENARVKCTPDNFRILIEKGMAIKNTIMANREIIHPFEEDLNFLYGTIFLGHPQSKSSDSRNVCIFAEGEVDRSPTGTGVSARMALHFAQRKIALNQPMVIESIIGSTFTGKVIQTTRFGDYDAVISEVKGTAYITGKHEFLIDPDDPLINGFILR
jgi:trans-L-3-hydroxyproline dehydratase